MWCWLLRGAAVVMVLLAAGCGAALSGFYADDGAARTVMQRALSPSDKRLLERELLGLLGLRARPRVPRRANLTGSASRFLLAVYDYRSLRGAPGLAPADRLAVDRSDAVVSFVARGHHAGAARHERGKRLWFDVSEVPAGETIVGSELRLYQTASELGADVSFTLSLYQLTSVSKGGTELRLVDSVETSCAHEGWLSLNATGPFAAWASSPESNQGLHVSARLATHPGHEIRPEEVGIVVDDHLEGQEPFLVAFLKTPQERRLHIREVRDTGKRRRRVGDSSWENRYVQEPFHSDSLHWNHASRSCQIHNLHVDFSELRWNDWIIAPEHFNAFFCSGECNFPLNAHVNPTNHAIVQTLAHLENPWKVPKPCCAPTKLVPVSIIFYTEQNTVAVHRYKEMIAKSCGCQ
ncbi:protein 60A-like isoform X2 [Bacillus rossius redtenbacheri]|uniref:protein 60A-like isoform X2 n=1 Tax=Bacillus rossius redtenbacheri TaxID=93214 RepID=UPI002FDCF678